MKFFLPVRWPNTIIINNKCRVVRDIYVGPYEYAS